MGTGQTDRQKRKGSHLLHDPAAIHIKRKLQDPSLHCPGEQGALGLTPVLKQLLYDIVAKHVLHELQAVARGHNFLKHNVALLDSGNLHLLLDKTTAMLVPRKLDTVAEDVLELPFACLVVFEFRKHDRTHGSVGVPRSRRVTSIHCVRAGVLDVLGGDPTDRAVVLLLLPMVVLPAGREKWRASKSESRTHDTRAIESWHGGALSNSVRSGVRIERGGGHGIACRTVEERGAGRSGGRGAVIRLLLLLTMMVSVWANWRVRV